MGKRIENVSLIETIDQMLMTRVTKESSNGKERQVQEMTVLTSGWGLR